LDDTWRHHWIETHILPIEGEVRGWLRRHVHSLAPADVDDLIQEAYARLWLADFNLIVNGRSYFYAALRNLLLEHARRAKIVPMERLGEIEALRIPSEEPGPERQATARQDLERLLAIVERLPEQCQRAFRLQKFYGYSQREIAKEMQISEKKVEKHLAAALLRVLDALRKGDRDMTSQLSDADRDDSRQRQD
jgi:RNA polymerase sigma factor (sigma-70 family)